MYNLERFGFTDMMDLRARLRSIFDEEPASIAEAGQRIARFFYEELADGSGRPACALVRLFKTESFGKLDDERKAFVRRLAPDADLHESLRCLVLVGTAGDVEAWNSAARSRGHMAIPLMSVKMVEEAPMIAQLIKQLGVSVETVLSPDPSLLLDMRDTSHNVFYVPVAEGSPFIVAQEEFVIPYRIQSVVGFGGMVASGDLFATIMFSRVPIGADTADLFKVIGLNLKLALLPVARKPLFVA
ncbi:MAG: hypothetical protein ACXV7D_14500 [Thermoanaerobaculia bacterium]